MPQLAQCSIKRAWIRHLFKHCAVSLSDGGQTTHTHIDTHPGIRTGHARLLGALNEYSHARVQPGTVAPYADCQHPRPVCTDQAFNPARVLVRADGADDRQREVPPVGLDTHRSGRERHTIGVASLLLETWETHRFALTPA